ncbi:MAG: hypothetical protein AMXMBFR13_00310 [Phycisphaerae bacterium]
MRVVATVVIGSLCIAGLSNASAQQSEARPGLSQTKREVMKQGRRSAFLDAKTCFQTNVAYDPRLAIAVDAVILHRHGEEPKRLARMIGSWKQKGFVVGRMFFADSDATNSYWTGKWDGTPHPEDVELNANGEKVLCSGVRPYMVPTDGWIRHLEEMTLQSIEAGADAILPEEPLAHAHTGYEKSFQELWVKRYGFPWEAEKDSPRARFLTAQLKNELYIELEKRLAAVTHRRSQELGRDIGFVLPIHSLYSNVAAQLVAPLGTSLAIPHVDGYIGQVWTGPVNWALVHYDSPDKSFFTSAYALYDYFVSLTADSGRKLWLLGDPVEDDPNHTWAEFEQWYRHCIVAKLLFPEVDSFEVMPWPDRIFLPGYQTGGKTPAPEDYRIALLSAIQVMQEVPAGGEWRGGSGEAAEPAVSEGVGVALADSVLWEKEAFPPLQGTYGLLLPLIHAGVPAAACVLERTNDAAYMNRFKVVVLSYEAFKPANEKIHAGLAAWVRRGGSLIVLGATEGLQGPFWWNEAGFDSPLDHLLKLLRVPASAKEGQTQVGKGWVLRSVASPREFGDPGKAKNVYLPLVEEAMRKAGAADGLRMPGQLSMRRGPFVIAHATREPLTLRGTFVDVLDAELPIRNEVTVKPGESGLYRDVAGQLAVRKPCLLHATHRVMDERFSGRVLRFVIRGPAETPAVARVFCGTRLPANISVKDTQGAKLKVESLPEDNTVRVKFPNVPEGAVVEMRW